MKVKGGKGFWGWSRRIFRWFRIFVLALILIGSVALLYLNRVGLPQFVKKRVVASLEAEGLDLEFKRLRLSGYRRVVIDDMSLLVTNAAAPIELYGEAGGIKVRSGGAAYRSISNWNRSRCTMANWSSIYRKRMRRASR